MTSAPIKVWLEQWPHDNTEPFVICAQVGNGPRIEFRGPPFESEGWHGSPAQKIHDALAGFHACILHAEGGPFHVLPEHEDFDAINFLVQENQGE